MSSLAPQFDTLISAAKSLHRKSKQTEGTLGQFRANGFPDLPDIAAGISSLNARARGRGSVASAVRGDLQRRVTKALASADSVKKLVSSNRGNIGRFRKDSTLATKTGHILAEIDTLRSLLTSPLGTIAAVHSDSVLARKLEEQHQLLAALMKDMKSNPMRYIKF